MLAVYRANAVTCREREKEKEREKKRERKKKREKRERKEREKRDSEILSRTNYCT